MRKISAYSTLGGAVRARARRHFNTIEKVIPNYVLRRVVLGSGVKNSLKDFSRPRVWRPLAEAALGDELLIQVDPKSIVGYVDENVCIHGVDTETKLWFVLPGEWDRDLRRPLKGHPSYARMADLVAHDDVRESESYKSLSLLHAKGEAPKRMVKMTTEGGIEGYFDFYRALADKIKETGQMPNFGVADKDRHVGLAIGRNGEFLQHQKGHHRTALAQLIPCAKMEAKVLAVHPLWLRRLLRKSELRKSGPPADVIVRGIASLAR